MLFNSINYFIFLIVILLVYYLTPIRLRWIILLVSGMAFYAVGGLKVIYVPVIITLVTWFSGEITQRAKNANKKKMFYLAGILTNLALLLFYKYINFFWENIFQLTKLFHINTNMNPGTWSSLVVPLGISFITFQAISYLVDIYLEKIKPEKNMGYFATYIFFFPKIISGPIERAGDFLPQLRILHGFDYNNSIKGLKRIVWGLFKKLVIANRLAIYTDAVFNNYEHHSAVTLLLASILYTFQLYADFSGYTDIAIGSARLFGFKLSENFNRPLFALSITEFWRKWHITLTKWVTDYIFTPIVINKRDWGKTGVVYSTIITFLILGFWHGANWTFIVFGLIHGIAISLEFLTKKNRKKFRKKIPTRLNTFLGILYVILVYSFSMIFFRSDSISQALIISKKIFSFDGMKLFIGTPSALTYGIFGIVFIMAYEFNIEFSVIKFHLFEHKNWFVQQLAYIALIILILMIGSFDGGQFIYFKF